MKTIENDDVAARIYWMNVPEHPISGELFGGSFRDFGSISNAVRHCMEQLPAWQRNTAWIGTDERPDIKYPEIAALYRD